jgi:hypothetical protein
LFAEFGAPVRSVQAFRKAAASDETLAMCNLGFKLLSSGFADEAQSMCDKALAIPNYHKNVPLLLTRLQEVPEGEEKKLSETFETVKPKAAFYRKLGDASVLRAPVIIAAKWQSWECSLEAVMEGTTIRMLGSYEAPPNRLAAIMSGGIGILSQQMIQHKVEFVGRLRGQMIIGHVSRLRDGQQVSTLGDGKVKVFMYFNSNGTELNVMENPQGTSPNFYTMAKVS